MTTFPELNQKLSLLLDDVEEPYTWSLPLRIESWNWAQRFFVTHTPRKRIAPLVLDSDGRSAVLPMDFFMAEGVFDESQEAWWYPISSNRPGAKEYSSTSVNEFWVWGNKLFLESTLNPGYADLKLYYFAYWPDVEYETLDDGSVRYVQSEVMVPQWAELPLMHLAIASCMVPGEVFASDLNQYKMRIESGNPLQNPRQQSAEWHYQMYLKMIAEYPATRRLADVGGR